MVSFRSGAVGVDRLGAGDDLSARETTIEGVLHVADYESGRVARVAASGHALH